MSLGREKFGGVRKSRPESEIVRNNKRRRGSQSLIKSSQGVLKL